MVGATQTIPIGVLRRTPGPVRPLAMAALAKSALFLTIYLIDPVTPSRAIFSRSIEISSSL